MITIRPARKEDTNAIREVVISIGKEFEIYNPSNPDNDIDDIIEAYHDQNGEFFVAEFNGRIVGTIGFHFVDSHFAKLRRFYVLPEFRGKGIGKSLLDHAIQLCKKKGYKAVITVTEVSLKRSFDIYTRAGFVVFKTTKAVNLLVKQLEENNINFSSLADRSWLIDWEDGCWRTRKIIS